VAEPTLVIGLGNLLMGDDSVGLVALERLRTDWELPDDIELMDGGTWGMNLLPFIEASDRVILLDAIQNNTAPGTLIELSGDQVPRALSHKLSPHQIDMREVLAVASLRGTLPRDLLAIGIEPFDTEMSTELSDVVAAAVPRLVTRAVQRLKSYGHPCVRHVSSAVCTS
jgi:hydrogenase maturation protease